MSLKKEFISYEQALALKELGFDEECLGFYLFEDISYLMINGEDNMYYNPSSTNLTLAPTFSQAFRWFREKYSLDKIVDSWTEQPVNNEIWDKAYQYYINGEAYHPYFKTYEEAELECLKKLIEIVKNK